MGKYFGTDGVRGKANVELLPEMVFKLGRYGGYVLGQCKEEHPKIYVARDTRISGQMLMTSLISGLLSVGIEVYDLGIIATPGLAYLVKKDNASAGIMITASHNPAHDNGIKFFGADGFKLEDEQELEIERLMDAQEDTLPRPSANGLGKLHSYSEALRKYTSFLISTANGDFHDFKIVLDTANGATATTARDVFFDLEADVTIIGDNPNGLNINDHIGSTHPEALVAKLLEVGAAVGLAFDGDGDRLIAVDETGAIINGDQMMYIIGKYLLSRGMLAKETIVTTVMANLGFHKALESEGINGEITAVGDRYVVEKMKKFGYNYGGEQSGHMIFLDYSPSGDGQLSAIQLLKVMRETGRKLSELAAEVKIFPQKLVNVKLVTLESKDTWKENAAIINAIEEQEAKLDGNGRILVRPSGTEPLLRVMVEAPTQAQTDEIVNAIAAVIEREIGL